MNLGHLVRFAPGGFFLSRLAALHRRPHDLIDKPDPLTAIFHLTKGYHRQFPLTESEAEALFPLIGARLLIIVTYLSADST